MNSFFSVASDFFGLDIGSTAVRLVHLKGGDSTSKTLVKYAYVPLEANLSASDAPADQQKLGQVISQLVGQARLSTRNVAVGIPSSRVFTTVADVERLPDNELSRSIPFQAESLIPTPLADSKIDWALIGPSPTDKTKEEVLITSVLNKFTEKRLDMLEAIGLNVIAFEPDNLAMARTFMTANAEPQLILDVGRRGTDLVVLMNNAPHLIRSIPTGVEAIIRAASQNLNIDEAQAEQFVLKFGLSREKLEGQVYQAIGGTIDSLTSEIEKSIKFFQTRYKGNKIQTIVVTGGASVIPEFPLYLANKYGINVEIGNSWRNVQYSRDRQNELQAISNQFGVAVGLAGRN